MRRIAPLGMSAVELLRAAVQRARELDAAATIAPWTEPEHVDLPGDEGWWVLGGGVPGSAEEHAVFVAVDYNPHAVADARSAATFRAVAAPLADLLAAFANPVDDEVRNVDELLAAVARALLPESAGATS